MQSKKCLNLITPHLCVTSHTHTHHRHKQPRRMRACALVELVGLVGLARCQSYTHGSTVGRVVYHSMAAAAGAAVDVSAVFAGTLATYQQQQQRSMAVWNLIMDGYDDDTELDAKLCVACCPCLLTVCCAWGAYDDACFNSHGCSLGAPKRARAFLFFKVLTVPQHTPSIFP